MSAVRERIGASLNRLADVLGADGFERYLEGEKIPTEVEIEKDLDYLSSCFSDGR